MAAAFSLIMLSATDSGDAYTFSQYEKMFRNAGFAKTTQHVVPDSPQQVLPRKNRNSCEEENQTDYEKEKQNGQSRSGVCASNSLRS